MAHEGQQLGKYLLLQLLGVGGYAEVYLGKHIHLGMEAAIKVLKPDKQLSGTDVQAFYDEGKTIARLHHPHIVKILDFGIEDVPPYSPYIVMDYAPHGTLRQRHPRATLLPLATVVSYVKQISDALQYAHNNKIVHRDVKPENMLIGRDGNILLSDFGIAVAAHKTDSMASQSEAGTVLYMAPEIFQEKAQPASDQYALAVVVYEWLCGTPPFTGPDAFQIAFQHAQTPPPPLCSKLPTIDPKVEQVVLKALAKDPKQRLASVQAFARALQKCLPDQMPLQTAPSDEKTALIALTPRWQTSNLPSIQRMLGTLRPKISRRDLIAAGLGGITVLAAEGIFYWQTHLPPVAPIYIYPGHNQPVQTVVWSPDGQAMASSGNDMSVQVWKVNSKNRSVWGEGIASYSGHTDIVRKIVWSPDGKQIASASDDMTVQIWNVQTEPHVTTYRMHTDAVYGVDWLHDGTRIVSGGFDKLVIIWDVQTGAVRAKYTSKNQVQCVAWSPDGTQIAVATAKTVEILDMEVLDTKTDKLSLNHIYTEPNKVTVDDVVWSPDGTHLASVSADKTVQVWDAKTLLRTFEAKFNDSAWGVAWSPNGKYLAAASKDNTVRVWEAGTWQPLRTYTGSDSMTTVAWSPDSTYYVAGSFDTKVYIWSI